MKIRTYLCQSHLSSHGKHSKRMNENIKNTKILFFANCQIELHNSWKPYVHILHMFTHSVGEMCLAKSGDGRWYRACSQGNDYGNSYQLIYLDYGNIETVHSSNIREIREDFMFPCLTLMCCIDGKHFRISKSLWYSIIQIIISDSLLRFER